MQKYLEAAGVDFQFSTEVTNVVFKFEGDKKIASAIECKVNGKESGIVFNGKMISYSFTNGSCTGNHLWRSESCPERGVLIHYLSGVWNLWKNIARQDHPLDIRKKFCSDISKTRQESATVTTLIH